MRVMSWLTGTCGLGQNHIPNSPPRNIIYPDLVSDVRSDGLHKDILRSTPRFCIAFRLSVCMSLCIQKEYLRFQVLTDICTTCEKAEKRTAVQTQYIRESTESLRLRDPNHQTLVSSSCQGMTLNGATINNSPLRLVGSAVVNV